MDKEKRTASLRPDDFLVAINELWELEKVIEHEIIRRERQQAEGKAAPILKTQVDLRNCPSLVWATVRNMLGKRAILRSEANITMFLTLAFRPFFHMMPGMDNLINRYNEAYQKDDDEAMAEVTTKRLLFNLKAENRKYPSRLTAYLVHWVYDEYHRIALATGQFDHTITTVGLCGGMALCTNPRWVTPKRRERAHSEVLSFADLVMESAGGNLEDANPLWMEFRGLLCGTTD